MITSPNSSTWKRRFAPAVASLAAVALAVVPDALAGPVGYPDVVGDASGRGADVSGVTISADAAGTIHIRVETPNHPTLETSENIQLLLDTDQDRSTGQNGFEYRIRVFGGDPTPIKLERADGTAVAQGSFSGSFGAGLSATVNRRDLGNTSGFQFALVTIDGTTGSLSDRVPDAALDERLGFALVATPVSPPAAPTPPQPPAPQPAVPQPPAPAPATPQPTGSQPAAPQPTTPQPTASQPPVPEPAVPTPAAESPAAAAATNPPAAEPSLPASADPEPAPQPPTAAPDSRSVPSTGHAPAVPPSSGGGPAGLSIVDVATSAGRPRPGKEFAAGIQVQDDRTGALLTRATITCTARVAGRVVRVAWKGYTEEGYAACGVRTPRGSSGKRLKLTITVKHGRRVARRVFSLRVG